MAEAAPWWRGNDATSPFDSGIAEFLRQAEELAADGLSLADLGQLLVSLVILAVELARGLAIAGPDKKELVLSSVALVYDRLIGFVPVPWWARLFWPFLAPTIRELVLAAASGGIEAAYAFVKARLPEKSP